MQHLYEFDCYQVGLQRRLVLRSGEVIPLPSKALDILLVLIQHRGEVVVKRGRGEHRYIVTVPGRGYRFVGMVIEHPRAGKEASTETSAGDPGVPGPKLSGRLPTSDVRKLLRRRIWLAAALLTVAVLAFALVLARPVIARFYNNRGVQFQQLGQLQTAMHDYERALILNPGYAEAHYMLLHVVLSFYGSARCFQ